MSEDKKNDGKSLTRRMAYGGPVKLEGFNNLTKSLSFNLYDFCVARDDYERECYVKYIHEQYNADKISRILKGICNIIDAQVIADSSQDYDPWGASSLILMSDYISDDKLFQRPLGGSSSVAHLDKSHICAHTYPDFRGNGTICSFRIDIDISTCGEISPLRALNYMFDAFESDVVVIDYVVRGYTRDSLGRRVYRDHDLTSIQDYIDKKILTDYYCVDLALQSDNIWQTKMLRTKLNEQSYFLNQADLTDAANRSYLEKVKKEMRGILYMWPE